MFDSRTQNEQSQHLYRKTDDEMSENNSKFPEEENVHCLRDIKSNGSCTSKSRNNEENYPNEYGIEEVKPVNNDHPDELPAITARPPNCHDSQFVHPLERKLKLDESSLKQLGIGTQETSKIKDVDKLNNTIENESSDEKSVILKCPAVTDKTSPLPILSTRKQRPNFIALPETNKPDLTCSIPRSIHSKIIQRSVQQQQNNIHANKIDQDLKNFHDEQSKDQLNGSGITQQTIHISQRENSTEDEIERSQNIHQQLDSAMKNRCVGSKEGATSFLSRVAARFLSPDGINSPSDSLCSLDSTPWNMDGTETIVENPSKKTRSSSTASALSSRPLSFVERELETLIEENKQLKASLEEAGRLNGQWRAYHQERQGYVERLLASIHTLQQRQISTSPPSAPQKTVEMGGEGREVLKLKEALGRLQAEYQEHVSLLQMQVRAHRDDWEAESAEKRLEKISREEAEARVALLLQELQHLQLQVNEIYKLPCNRCGAILHSDAISQTTKMIPYNGAVSSNNVTDKNLQLVGPGSIIFKKNSVNNDLRCKATTINGTFHPQNRNEVQTISQASHCPTSNGLLKIATIPEACGQVIGKQNMNGKFNQTSPSFNSSNDMHPQIEINNRQKEVEVRKSNTSHPLPKSGTNQDMFGSHVAPRNEIIRHTPVSTNIPLKGWIPVSMMHQIAFGGSGDSRRLQYPNSISVIPSANYSNDVFPYQSNGTSSTSRESSLLSCTSSEFQSETSNFVDDNHSKVSHDITGARPRTRSDDDRRNAKHRARSILTNAIPASPVSSSPTTPAGGPPRSNISVCPPQTQQKKSGFIQRSSDNQLVNLNDEYCKHRSSHPNSKSHNSNSTNILKEQDVATQTVESKNNHRTHTAVLPISHTRRIHSPHVEIPPSSLIVIDNDVAKDQQQNYLPTQILDVVPHQQMFVQSNQSQSQRISIVHSPQRSSDHSPKSSEIYSPRHNHQQSCKTNIVNSPNVSPKPNRNQSSQSNSNQFRKSDNNRSINTTSNSPSQSNENKFIDKNGEPRNKHQNKNSDLSSNRSPRPKHNTKHQCNRDGSPQRNRNTSPAVYQAETSVSPKPINNRSLSLSHDQCSHGSQGDAIIFNKSCSRCRQIGKEQQNDENSHRNTMKSPNYAHSIIDQCQLLNKSQSKTFQSEADLEVKLINANVVEGKSDNVCNKITRQISSSTSNETSRSSSPGMSLTTFAMTSEGRGIPGAICFSLHPEVRPSINSGVISSSDPPSPKKDRNISHVHIEPRSPKAIKSPIEISTKEHWWSVGEQEHFSYPENVDICMNDNNLINSPNVPLNDVSKKDNQQIVNRRKLSQDEQFSENEGNLTSKTTFLFTPAVNSSTSSSNVSSRNSSKTSSPPPQPTTHLKSMASKNIASAIISYEIAAKGDRIVYADRLKPTDVPPSYKTSGTDKSLTAEGKSPISPEEKVKISKTKTNLNTSPDGVVTLTSRDIICPSCQMIFQRRQHLKFLDHFETCKGPEFADL